MTARDRLARLADRPTPGDWTDDEPMTLFEYVAVFYPRGPLTVASLRTEIRKGRLPASDFAGKLFITPAQVRALFRQKRCPATPKVPGSTSERGGSAAGSRSPTSTSSETEALRSAQAAAQIALLRLSKPSSFTSRPNARTRHDRTRATPATVDRVIPLRS